MSSDKAERRLADSVRTVEATASQLRAGMQAVRPKLDLASGDRNMPRILAVGRVLQTKSKVLCWWSAPWCNNGCSYPPDARVHVVLNEASAVELDSRYQRLFKDLKPGQVCPPCPRCGGLVVPLDMHIITGAECTVCKWSMVEGAGCLA